MNRITFFKLLTKEISSLPKEEQQNALDYYNEYFNDCESEELAIKNLPHPSEIANNLYKELGIERQSKKERSGLELLGIILIIVLSAPLVFSLLITIFCIIVIVPFSMLIATGLTAIASTIVLIPATVQNPSSFLSILGLGMLSLGSCLLFLGLTKVTFIFFINGCKKIYAQLRGY